VEALRTARHNRVLDTISKDRLKFAKKVGIIHRNKALTRTDPPISIEFISQLLIEDLPYRRSATVGASLLAINSRSTHFPRQLALSLTTIAGKPASLLQGSRM